MSGPRGPLSVRVWDGTEDRVITRHVSGLKFSKVSNGGHKATSMRVNLPTTAFADLGPSDRLWIDDSRTGRNLLSAYTQNPTPTDGPAGQGFDLSALGGMALASDETRALVYIDRDLGQFEQENTALASSSIDVAPWEDDETKTRLRATIPSGTVVGTGEYASAISDLFVRSNIRFGGIRVGTFYAGKGDPNYALDFVTPTATVVQVPTTAAFTLLTFVGDPGFPSDTTYFALKFRRTGGATNVADDLAWGAWVDFSVIGQRVDRFGNLLYGIPGLRSASDVRASEVVEDLIGRLLTTVDPRRADIAATTMPINQLSFPDGATAQRVLDELGDFEADMRWGVGSDDGRPRSEGGRGHEFWYRPVPSQPRYEITTQDSYRQPGAETDLCNRIAVAWSDATGKQQTTVIEATSDQYPALLALEDAGRVRDADPVTLPDGKGSANNALVIGHQILAAKASPPRSGTAVVSRYVRDLWAGMDVHPCEIEPGCLVQVRSTGEVIEMTEMEYDDEAGGTTMTLGDPIPTEAQRFARLSIS